MGRTKTLVDKLKRTNDRGKVVAVTVCKIAIDGQGGKPMSWNAVEIFSPFQFTRKEDDRNGEGKAGEQAWGKGREISMGRLHEVVEMLAEVDNKYNQGKAFAQYRSAPLGGQQTTTLEDDEIPF